MTILGQSPQESVAGRTAHIRDVTDLDTNDSPNTYLCLY